MRASLRTHRLAVAVVVASGALGLLAGPGSAGAVVPGTNGLIVATKFDDPLQWDAGTHHLVALDPSSGVESAVTGGGYADEAPSVSPDGSRIVFERCTVGGTCRIAAVGIGGGSVTNLTAGAAADEADPTFSPDGAKLVFERVTDNRHLVVMDANGGNGQPLTSGSDADHEPTWSPDGATIAFSRCGNNTCRIYQMPAGGGSPTPLTAGPDDRDPNYSPDGSRIVFERQTPSGETIWTMDASGGNQHLLTSAPAGFQDWEPAFSPDASKIAFVRSKGEGSPAQLMIVDADGTNPHSITSPSEVYVFPDWQPLHPAGAAGGSNTAGTALLAPLGLTLAAPKKESIHKGRVYLFATSSKAAAGAANGKVSVPKLAKSYRLRPTSKTLSADARTKITLKIPRKTLRAVREALARHQRVKATLVVRVTDGAGNTTSKQLRIRLAK